MTAVWIVVALVGGVGAGWLVRKAMASGSLESAEARAARTLAEAEREAESRVRDALQEVKDEIAGMRREADEDVRGRREEIRKREETLSRREEALEARLGEIDQRDRGLQAVRQEVETIRTGLEQDAQKHRAELERVSRLTAQEAKEALMGTVVEHAKRDAMGTVREIEQQAREEGERRARKIVTLAIQRVAT